MNTRPINLLSKERRHLFAQQYAIRLGVVGLLIATFLIAAHAALLFPSFAFLQEQIVAREARLATLASSLTEEEAQIENRLARLETQATSISEIERTPTFSRMIGDVLLVPRTNIRISSIAFARGALEEHRMVIQGVAKTRDALRQYDIALSSLAGVSRTELPIGAYAKETDISFSIELFRTVTN